MRPVPLGFAALVAAVVVVRWRHIPWTIRVAGIVGAVALVLYGTGMIDLPDPQKALADIGERLGKWTYALVGAVAFLETGAFVGLIAPGEVTVIAGASSRARASSSWSRSSCSSGRAAWRATTSRSGSAGGWAGGGSSATDTA